MLNVNIESMSALKMPMIFEKTNKYIADKPSKKINVLIYYIEPFDSFSYSKLSVMLFKEIILFGD